MKVHKSTKGFVLVITACLVLMAGGCGKPRNLMAKATSTDGSSHPATAAEDDQQTKGEINEHPQPAPPEQEPDGSGIVKVVRLDPVRVQAGDRDGVFLSDGYIQAVDSHTNEPIHRLGFGSPRWGSLKVFGTGHFRYYPPAAPCHDEIKVELTTESGEKKEVVLPVEVGACGARLPESPRQPRISSRRNLPSTLGITLPQKGDQIAGRICNVEGEAPNSPNGARLTLFVRPIDGVDYRQSDSPTVQGGHFNGFVYLGNAEAGTGEPFEIWVIGPGGQKSPVVTVTRIQ